jgi:hypothetical protein
MPSFGRIDGQKCEATEPPGARTSLPIFSVNASLGAFGSVWPPRVWDGWKDGGNSLRPFPAAPVSKHR